LRFLTAPLPSLRAWFGITLRVSLLHGVYTEYNEVLAIDSRIKVYR